MAQTVTKYFYRIIEHFTGKKTFICTTSEPLSVLLNGGLLILF